MFGIQAIPRRAAPALLLAAALLASCGGGDGDPLLPLPGVTCSTLDERVWLDARFDDWYFWYRQAPNPNPTRDFTLGEFFQASLYTGSDPAFPADRWSNFEPSADFDRFFSQGRQLGYGLFLAGLEVAGQPGQPLRVRYVAPGSDAERQGVQRGDELLSADGRSAAEIIASNDYAAFSPTREGQTVALVLRRAGLAQTLTLRASAYALQPASLVRVLQSPQGRRLGYVHVKDMVNQAEDSLASAFADFKAQGVQDLVIDLRYNGGGLVSLSRTLASYVAAPRTRDQTYTRLLFNDKRDRANNETFRFSNPSNALNLSRVYVLTGPRTCSASELLINGLRPYVEVVTVGAATCGKPVGFEPVSRCDTTFSIVNFEAVNASGQGRYWDGIAARCAVADDLDHPLGSSSEALLATAARHADGQHCSAVPTATLRRPLAAGAAAGEPAERQGMWNR